MSCTLWHLKRLTAFFVFIIVALISSPKRKDDDDVLNNMNITSNDTLIDELTRASIASYATSRDKVGVDKNGQLKEKW